MPSETSVTPRSLFGGANDRAIVFGIPDDFELGQSLSRAGTIYLVTAFAHRSGWTLLKNPVVGCGANVFLLTGLDFCQTEPAVLKDWRSLAKKTSGVRARVFRGSQKYVFHPKMLVVLGKETSNSFAIVGSGNLSRGGYVCNYECSLYTEDPCLLKQLVEWLEVQWKNGIDLANFDLEGYASSYRVAKRASMEIKQLQRGVESDLDQRITARILIKRYGLGVSHGLYRRDGTWYHMLKKFPAALLDNDGYVEFASAQEFESCGALKLYPQKDQVGILKGIASIPTYQKFPSK